MINLTPKMTVSVTLTGTTTGRISLDSASAEAAVELVPFLKGDKGDPGDAASVSADAGNVAALGTDGGIFVSPPQLETTHW